MLDASEKAAVYRYVHEFERVGDDLHISTFRAAVRDARQLCGRDVDTGAIVGEPTALWPASLTYLVLLEQIGKVIRPTWSKRRKPSRDLRAALGEWHSGLNQTDLDMLYALRCAFGHEFAMANENANHPTLQHRFELHDAGERTLVKYNGQWNGVYGAGAVGGPTAVNLRELAEVVEAVVVDIERSVAARDVRLIDGVDLEMVLNRWGFRVLGYFK
jgi:hypothetical protein